MRTFNLGNPVERTVTELAELVLKITRSASDVQYHPLPVDDPLRRRPVITRAQERLGWYPDVDIEEGLRRTVNWFASRPQDVAAGAAAIRGGQQDGVPVALPVSGPLAVSASVPSAAADAAV